MQRKTTGRVFYSETMTQKLALAAALTLISASPALAQDAGYATPLGTPEGKITVVIPEGETVEPVYVPAAARGVTTGATDLFNPGDIRYLSGGIGADEQAKMRAAEADYAVKITFASEDGAFISDVQVDVKDSKGADILSLITDGPVLLLDLKPGSYTLNASDGVTVKEHGFRVAKKAAFAIHFPPK